MTLFNTYESVLFPYLNLHNVTIPPSKFRLQKIKLIKSLVDRKINKNVLDSMTRVPREMFVPLKKIEQSNLDVAIQLHGGSSISQPFVVATMLNEIQNKLENGVDILELGTGSGYNVALLQDMLRKNKEYTIYSMEVKKGVLQDAVRNLSNLYHIKHTRKTFGKSYYHLDDGKIRLYRRNGISYLQKKRRKWDVILCTAALQRLHTSCLNRLKDRGILVAPIKTGTGEKLLTFQKFIYWTGFADTVVVHDIDNFLTKIERRIPVVIKYHNIFYIVQFLYGTRFHPMII